MFIKHFGLLLIPAHGVLIIKSLQPRGDVKKNAGPVKDCVPLELMLELVGPALLIESSILIHPTIIRVVFVWPVQAGIRSALTEPVAPAPRVKAALTEPAELAPQVREYEPTDPAALAHRARLLSLTIAAVTRMP